MQIWTKDEAILVKSDNAPGRDDWIRTSDTYVPNVALYQAELHPAPFN